MVSFEPKVPRRARPGTILHSVLKHVERYDGQLRLQSLAPSMNLDKRKVENAVFILRKHRLLMPAKTNGGTKIYISEAGKNHLKEVAAATIDAIKS